MLSMTRLNALDELTDLSRELDHVLGRSLSELPMLKSWSWVPATDVISEKQGWKLKMALPGIDPKDVRVELNHNQLTVSGERKVEEKSDQHFSEISYGRFERSFALPETVDTETVSADFENGMLELTLPSSEANTKRRRIEIRDVKASKKAT